VHPSWVFASVETEAEVGACGSQCLAGEVNVGWECRAPECSAGEEEGDVVECWVSV